MAAMKALLARAKSGEHRQGSSVLETALALLIVIPIVLGVFDLGRAVYIHSVVAAAAQEGARYGLVHRGDTAGIANAAKSQAVGLDPAMMSISVIYPDYLRIEVTVDYIFAAVTPVIGDIIGEDGHLTLSSTARMWN